MSDICKSCNQPILTEAMRGDDGHVYHPDCITTKMRRGWLVEKCIAENGELKVNLLRDGHNGNNGEGIWATPLTNEDARIANDDKSHGEQFKCLLLNHPAPFMYADIVPWQMRVWGCTIVATTNGKNRAVAFQEHQSDFDVEALEFWQQIGVPAEISPFLEDRSSLDTLRQGFIRFVEASSREEGHA